MALTTEIILHFHFHFKVFPEKERERERASAREEEDRAPVRADLASSNLTTAIRDHDLAQHRVNRN